LQSRLRSRLLTRWRGEADVASHAQHHVCAGAGSQISGGWMRLAHSLGVQAWLSRQHPRLFTFESGRRVDIGWYTDFDAKTIKPVLGPRP
jgi:hypothetical protein